MSKMRYFSNKFSKIAKHWGLFDPSASKPSILVTFAWFIQIVFFQTDYDEIELKKNQLWCHFSDVIVPMSPKNVTKITSQDFSILVPSQSKFLATPMLN